MDRRQNLDFTSRDQLPKRMLLNTRDLKAVSLVERLRVFGRTVQDTKAAGEVSKVLAAIRMLCVVG